MQSIGALMAAICLLLPSISSCSSVALHENFKDHMSHTVGKHIDDPHTWARPDRYVGNKVLPNGNTENEYEFRGACRYYFEIDWKTRIIVGWRFEGSERDCEIVP
jgi:hypothetical protein